MLPKGSNFLFNGTRFNLTVPVRLTKMVPRIEPHTFFLNMGVTEGFFLIGHFDARLHIGYKLGDAGVAISARRDLLKITLLD